VRKRILMLLTVVALFIATLILQAAADPGLELFRSKCGECHKEGGEGPVFAPTKYASKQWKRFFKRNKHKRKKDISGKVTKDEQKLIEEYLMNHAADSSQPEAAGLR